jgi:RNA polymerase sigma factor (sigma-70 family)
MSAPTMPSDRQLQLAAWLARAGLGDRAAFSALYEATSAPLFAVILRINRDRSQAEELLQDLFVSVWHAASSFDAARSQPMTWLATMARNRAIDSLRRQKAAIQTVSLHADDDADGDAEGHRDARAGLVERTASDAPGPMELLQHASEARALTGCIGQLSAVQQQCMALAYYQGLSYSEVAEHLAEPLGTVKSWVRRALMTLKECLTGAVMRGPGQEA